MSNPPIPGTLPPGVREQIFEPAPPPGPVSFAHRGLQPPSRVYVESSDILVILALNQAFQTTLTTRVRLLRADGQIVGMEFTDLLPVGASRTVGSHRLTQGFLLSLVCTVDVTGVDTGGPGVIVGLQRDSVPVPTFFDVLLQGPVFQFFPLAWPQAPLRRFRDQPGRIRDFLAPNPTVATDFVVSPPITLFWRLIGFRATLVTSATVATRTVNFNIRDQQGNTSWDVFARTGQTASTVIIYYAYPLPSIPVDATTKIYMPIPPGLILTEIGVIESSTQNLSPGDQWTAITIYVEEWYRDQ